MTAPVATKLPPPGASAFPHLSPRPAYGPAWPYVLRAFCRILRFPLLCTAFHVWTEPGYAHAYSLFTSRMRDAAPDTLGWMHRDDLFFTVGLSSFISVIWVVENTFFYACDHFKLLQQYKMHRTRAMEPAE